MNKRLAILGWALIGLVMGAARATTTQGTINATLTLTNGCLINGNAATSNANFGTLDFGTHPATFDTISATLTGATGSGIRIRCTDGATYTVQITGSNSSPSNVYGTQTNNSRFMVSSSDSSQGIAYTLYNDAAYNTPIANNINLVPSGTPDPVNGDIYPVYGRITQGNNNTAIPAGTYSDVINVQVVY
ncbi:Csu type fimbrial protein [Martelella alba]|uniref:Spore coat protein U domain-containing protein n=1 Tax=Martelella alba TaxID=2590451 RepID=A0ABY2SNA2_9HYPH|nr:spore coat protein U domain-containing protein [Martelella alba]TKI07244.1 spore coat protein U domain-containing protein [Martelella alba]